MKSEQINELATALAKAQGQIKGAVKDATNPHYKSQYADLESVWEAIRKPLSDNGLAVVQPVMGGELHTYLIHSTGQWIQSIYPLIARDQSPQALGSSLTYARRYALAAMVGVYQTDDDGEGAEGRKGGSASSQEPGDLGAYVMPVGKYKGMTLEKMGPHGVNQWLSSMIDLLEKDGKKPEGALREAMNAAHAFVESRATPQK